MGDRGRVRRRVIRAEEEAGRLPPQAIDAERGVLGCLLLDTTRCLPDLQSLPADFLYEPRHATTYRAIRDLAVQGRPVDQLTLAQRLADAGELDRVGGHAYLAELVDNVPSAANLSYYLEPVRDAWQRRQLIAACTKTARDAHEKKLRPDELLKQLTDEANAIAGAGTRTRCATESIGSLVRPSGNDPDELLRHRFLCRGGGLLLAAPTGIGKSTFSLQALLCWSVGRDCLGIVPARPLRCLYIQAENDQGDLAELRDGIVTGLAFTEDERKAAFDRVKLVTVDDLCGPEFVRQAVAPLCREGQPDLIVIDPLLSYIGGDVSRQEVVSPWLRNCLNPVLHRTGCGCLLVHHTNKPPTGEQKREWTAGDFAYLGSGSSDLANWARAVIAIRSLGSPDVYELRLAKRGRRVGWTNTDGSPCYARNIAHGLDGIYWRLAEANEVPQTGREAGHSVEEIIAVLDGQELATSDWQRRTKEEFGVSERSFYRLKRLAVQGGLVSQSKISGKWFKTQ